MRILYERNGMILTIPLTMSSKAECETLITASSCVLLLLSHEPSRDNSSACDSKCL